MNDAGRLPARLFVALELPPAIRGAVVAWREPVLAANRSRLRAVTPDALHVTLCFLGAQTEDEIDAIAATCATALADAVPAGTALGRSLWLPRRRPRVLALGLDDATGALAAMQARLADALTAGGWYSAERRPYLPHVTVARVRGELGDPTVVPDAPAAAYIADRVALLRSHLGEGQARYEPLAGWTIR